MCADHLAGGTGGQLHLGHRSHRGQRLAAEAQGGDAVQVAFLMHLAGGVTQEGRRHIFAGNTTAIIRNTHIGHAAVTDLHCDMARTGINGIFQQFLDDRGGPLNHLAGSNQLRHMLVQHPDIRHSILPPCQPVISSRQPP